MLDNITAHSSIWLPGKGVVPGWLRAATRAVEEYDRDLSLGRHEQTGEWVVLLQRGPMTKPHPVFGLGDDLPSPEEIKKRLYNADVRRHGGKIVAQLQAVEDRRAKEVRSEVDAATEEVAEAFAWAHRKKGTHPAPRVFMSKKGDYK